MATQVKSTNAPSGEYVVIDNGAAPAANTVSFDGAAISYDTVSTGGATAQGSNTFKNGTIPDFLAAGATIILNSPQSTRLLFKNPA